MPLALFRLLALPNRSSNGREVKYGGEIPPLNYITVGDSSIEPVKSVRNLGSWLDEHIVMDIHTGNICCKAFKGLYNIRQLRKIISTEAKSY